MVPRTMSSTVSACLSTHFGIKGLNYSITSACATSTHCIGEAMEQIQWGKQDVVFAGGGEEEDWTLAVMFDAMGALSAGYNDTPATASRAYDANRDGFVIAAGGGMLVLEELEHAKARGAQIYAEIVGYGATSDGDNMVAPSGEGAVRCMQQAFATVEAPIDYINTHGTSTPMGDIAELEAMRTVFQGAGAAVQFQQVAVRTLAGRCRCAGSHSLPADAGTGLHGRFGQYFRTGSEGRRPAGPAGDPRSAGPQNRDEQQFRLWRHQCQPGVSAVAVEQLGSGQAWYFYLIVKKEQKSYSRNF